MSGARVYWLTGLSGAGKSTLCERMVGRLRERGRSVVMLDGDALRDVFGATAHHSRDERLALALRYSALCKILAAQGFDVAIATISLFHEVHAWNRAHLPGYLEIYLDVPLHEVAQRDPKGIYARAAAGELKNVAGVDLAVDVPRAPDVHLRWQAGMTEDEAFAWIAAKAGL